jgi:hypothetical protein
MIKFPISLLCLSVAYASHAELIGLEDELMEVVTGQSGLTVELHQQTAIGEVQYSDADDTSGGILDLKGIVIESPDYVADYATNPQAITLHEIDLDGTDGLVVRSTYEPTRLKIGSVSVGDHRGSASDGYATRQSFGTFMFDYEGTRELKIQAGGSVGQGFTISNQTDITNSDIRWQTNGNTLLVDNLAYSSTVSNMTIDLMDFSGTTGFVFGIPSASYSFTLGGLCFAETTDCLADGSNSLGQLAGAMAFKNSYVNIFGGGREGSGITIDSYFEIDETSANYFTYTDSSALHIADMTGSITTTGLTLDIGTGDTEIGDHIAIQVDSVVGTFKADTVEIGAQSLGSVEVDYTLSDGVHDSVTYQNVLKLAPGIAWAGQDFTSNATLVNAGFDDDMAAFYAGVTSTNDGLSMYREWNLVADFSYSDDGNTINISNFQSHGKGYASIDVRNDGSESYIALGLVDYQGSYSIDGFKVGKATDDPKTNASLQGGTELLLPLGIYPSYEFTINGGIKMSTGGATGSGLSFDGDLLISDATFAFSTNILNYDDGDPNNDRVVGVWADDVTYEYHFRNYTLDVENDGIKLVQGEKWSDMDIGNLRWGDKNTGESLGRVRMQTYQTDSQLVITAGGAGGASCLGGTGVDLGTCEASGGYWVDKGTEGVTIAMKQNWEQRSGEKANVFTWENNRTVVDGKSVNGTGTSIVFDNITTSDGYNGTDNTHGIQLELAIDVAPTKVLNKADPTQEKIMTGASTYEYKDSATLTVDDKTNRPMGFAVAASLQFKELDIESVNLIHANQPTIPQTMIHGFKMQNFNIQSNLTATPIQ